MMLTDTSNADYAEIVLIGMLYLLGIVVGLLVLGLIAMLYTEAPQKFAAVTLLLLGAFVTVFGCGYLHVTYVRPWWHGR